MNDKLSRQNCVLYVCGIIPVVWLALLAAPLLEGGLGTLLEGFGTALENPFHIVWCDKSLKTLLIFLMLYGLGIGMQASECGHNTQYPRTPGGITDPEYSIAVGIQNLADCLQTAGAESPIDLEHIQLALQGYNFGSGYITWALQKYGEYSRANAVEFSMKMAEQMGWNSYGDKQYVPHVLRYYPIGKVFYTPEDGDAIVDVALTQIGNVGGEPYWIWYGFTSRVEWCACFVSWCADQCGYLDSGAYPKFSGCVFGMQWFQQRGLWLDGSAEPMPGMLIFFDWATQDGVPDHVGIVERVENNVVYTVEGNSKDMCRQKQYSLGSRVILGYGMPASV